MHNGVAPTTAAGASGATASEAATAPPPAGGPWPGSAHSHGRARRPDRLPAGLLPIPAGGAGGLLTICGCTLVAHSTRFPSHMMVLQLAVTLRAR